MAYLVSEYDSSADDELTAGQQSYHFESDSSEEAELSDNVSSLMSSFAAGTHSFIGRAEIQDLQTQIRAQLARLCGEFSTATQEHQSSHAITTSSARRSRSRSVGDPEDPRNSATQHEHSNTESQLRQKTSRSLEKNIKLEDQLEVKTERQSRPHSEERLPKVEGIQRVSRSIIRHSELELIQMALLQLGALKALTVILSSSNYVELLLVPKAELTPKKHHLEVTTQMVDVEEMQSAIRSIMKQMVKRAILPSPVKSSITMAELERAQMVLLQTCFSKTAEEQTGVKEKISTYTVHKITEISMSLVGFSL